MLQRSQCWVPVLVGFQTERRWGNEHMCSLDFRSRGRMSDFLSIIVPLRFQRICDSQCQASGSCCVCTGLGGAGRFEAGTLLTITQGGVHRGAQSPYAATPPRLALSGALVLNAGNRRQPTACSAVDCVHAAVLHGAKRRISGMNKP